MSLLTSKCEFDCLQDVAGVGAWALLGGQKDSFFVYRQGGRLSAYISQTGGLNANLSTEEGYANIRSAILSAVEAGPGPACPEDPPLDGHVRQGDFNADGTLDMSDAVGLLGHLFRGSPANLPCGGSNRRSPSNLAVLDSNGDGDVDLSDAVYALDYLFVGGPPPAAGTECIAIAECANACGG